MEFDVAKCATIATKRGKRVHCDGIALSEEECTLVAEDDSYSYLGILELDDIIPKEIKEM